jgi:hypothetical protein
VTRPGRRRGGNARADGVDDLLIRDQRAAVVPVRVGLLVDALPLFGLEQRRPVIDRETGVLQGDEQLIGAGRVMDAGDRSKGTASPYSTGLSGAMVKT